MEKDTNSNKNAARISRRELILEVTSLWEIYGANYATCVSSYRALLQRKRELKMRLDRIPESTIRELPDIPFLKIAKPEEAKAYLEKLKIVEIKKLIHHINYMVKYDHAYRMITSTVKEYEYQIRNYGKKNLYGIDPDSIGMSKGARNRSSGRNVMVDETK